MNTDRIPDFTDQTSAGMSRWFSEMASRGLLFHPEERPADILRIDEGTPLFTATECEKLDGILKTMFDRFGDGVCEEAYPIFMKAAGFPD